MIYLDTHVVVWLYTKDAVRLSHRALSLVEEHDLRISPAVLLELEYLYETKRITETGRVILEYLEERIGLVMCHQPFGDVVRKAAGMRWTRDPFDRLIAAQAAVSDAMLLTKDGEIHTHYPHAVWN